LAFHKDGVTDVCRAITRDLPFDGANHPSGTVRAEFSRLALGAGSYTISIMIAAEGYYDSQQTVFFSVNHAVYACLSRAIEFTVAAGGGVAQGTGVVAEAAWSIEGNPRSAPPTSPARAEDHVVGP
jgi:hypothetical protein